MGGSRSSVRAMARRWRCPPDRVTPRSPTGVLVALWQTYYEIVKLGYLGGADHIGVGCVIDAVLDVVANRGAEDEHVLQDDPDVPAKRRQRGLAGIRPIDQHTPRGDIVEPRDNVH